MNAFISRVREICPDGRVCDLVFTTVLTLTMAISVPVLIFTM